MTSVAWDPTTTTGELWLDIGMGWLVRYSHTDHWLDFKAYEVVAKKTDDDGTRYFHLKGASSGMDHTTNPEEADCLAGYVKWDGCCEIHFPDDQPHFCGRQDVMDFTEVIRQLHSLAALLPSVDRDLAGMPHAWYERDAS